MEGKRQKGGLYTRLGKATLFLSLVWTALYGVQALGGPSAASEPALAHEGSGFLEICKETQGGLTGTFTFDFAGQTQSVTVSAGATQPVCTPAIELPAGEVTITERDVAGTELCGVRTVPADRLLGTSGRSATVSIVAGGIENLTNVIFCNKPKPPGVLKLCKAGGMGVTGNFTFTIRALPAGMEQTVVVGVGQCVVVGEFPHSTTVEITETVPAGQTVTFTVAPAGELRPCPTPAANRVCAHISGGVTTEVTATNVIKPPGVLKICKVAGTGITTGTNFTFTVKVVATGMVTTVTVPAGNCAIAGMFPESTVLEITETLPTGVELVSITVNPASETRTCAAPAVNKVCVHISSAVTTEVTFKNKKAHEVCPLTKGFYRNHPEATAAIVASLGGTLTIGGQALTAEQVQAILDATPGQPGNVTFTSNLLLNLNQQLIAALLNLEGDVSAAPAEVQAAIAEAQAGIDVSLVAGQIVLTTTLTDDEVSALVDVLSRFNEGQFAGFPRCS
jgi:hypothetical protein